ncbi:PepSY-associated TM helix domain-containing protein [Aquimarina sp. W85]|uniref:PepSY-associated TM helix domain-containing protein n=1 Tax=Aquimarina rhodophyticola TaxID=3342246 RepID=UPI00366D8CE9
MKKNTKLNQWLWKWHFIAGIISLPFILCLSITGGIYLFKTTYEKPIYKEIKTILPSNKAISYQQQWELAKESALKKPTAVIVPSHKSQATEFVSGRFGAATSIFIDPYKGEVSGEIVPMNSLMYKIRKLHGELLLGTSGTLIIELIASWMVVLLITGIFIWWPARGWQLKGFFVPRLTNGKQVFYRDLHAITGFWIAILLLITLAGGFPWTNVFGSNFKWIQQVTNTGFPKDWYGKGLLSTKDTTSLTLDQMIDIARDLDLLGTTKITFPQHKDAVYTISNSYPKDLNQQVSVHFDQYSGKMVQKKEWQDVGLLMRSRMWVMAFHQGQFGNWNWVLMLCTTLFLSTMSLAAILSYTSRKKKGSWSIPNVPKSFTVSYGVAGLILLLGIVFPLFGASVILIIIFTFCTKKEKTKLTTS